MKVCAYGQSIFDQLPGFFRHSILLALTDLKSVTFIRMVRYSGGETIYEISPEMTNVLATLCAVKRKSLEEVRWIYPFFPHPHITLTCIILPAQLDVVKPPEHVRLSNDATDLQPESFLGCGASGAVYSYKTESSTPKIYAVKSARGAKNQASLQHERLVLLGFESPSIPRIVGYDNNNTYLVMEPVGELLSTELMQELSLSLLVWMPKQLVSALEYAHSKGYVHRDVRPANIIVSDMSSSQPTAILIDWAFACKFENVTDQPYSGTIHHASRKTLLFLEKGQVPSSKPADDLESLVRCFFSLHHPLMAVELSGVLSEDCKALTRVWDKWLRDRPGWIEAQEAAETLDYRRVESLLSVLLQ